VPEKEVIMRSILAILVAGLSAIPAVAGDPVEDPPAGPTKKEQFKMAARERLAVHRCEPDGCPTPIGCGNLYSEFKFVFGSCRQFFGTAGSTEGHLHKTYVPPPEFKYIPAYYPPRYDQR